MSLPPVSGSSTNSGYITEYEEEPLLHPGTKRTAAVAESDSDSLSVRPAKRVARGRILAISSQSDYGRVAAADEDMPDTVGGDDEEGVVTDPEVETGEPPPPPPRITMDQLSEKYQNLSRLAEQGVFDELVGRHNEVHQVLLPLIGGFQGGHVQLYGEEGIGKRTLVNRLAYEMNHRTLPSQIAGKQLVTFDFPEALKQSYSWYSRFKEFLEDCHCLKDEVICVIPNLHEVLRKRNNKNEALALLSQNMDDGLQTIITTDNNFSLDRLSVEGSIVPIQVGECNLADLEERLVKRYCFQVCLLGVTVSEEAARCAFAWARKDAEEEGLNPKELYARACQLLEMAVAEARLDYAMLTEEELMESAPFPYVSEETVDLVVKLGAADPMNGISGGKPVIGDLQIDDPLRFAARLKEHVLGQDHAVDAVAKAIQIASVDLRGEENRGPVAQFMFMGTTGVGKTELARAISKELGYPMYQFDMSEYQEEHTVSRLFGSPPGYVGYDQGGQLTNALNKTPKAVILFDELEKANLKVLDAFLQIFDSGQITDGQGKTTDCTQAIFIMTSNIASMEITNLFSEGMEPEEVAEAIKPYLLQRGLRPEWLNRLTNVLAFRPISEEVFRKLMPIKLEKRFRVVSEKQEITVEWDDGVYDWLYVNGYTPEFGLRPLQRLVEDSMIHPLAVAMLKGDIGRGDSVYYYVEDNKLCFKKDGA